ncbi:MAG: MBL fold metallo-hydrolase [Muribaculaceae bacterium]|nr:MBL fold metallo-hydrolase [Muribaculaceae bacterium]
MTKVTYLDHSGFTLTTPHAILVFDYYRDPSHSLKKELDENPELPVIFFVSHRHSDHYNPGIFEIAQNRRRTYVISNDVPAREIPSTLAVAGMSAGDTIENLPGNIEVRAYGSTDAGVSFLVTTSDGKKIFHAGDLNDWHWQDESTPQEAEQAHHRFQCILDRIAADNPVIDIAMFPVDSRQGTDYSRGARMLLQSVDVKEFFPMHFGAAHDNACDFDTYSTDPETRCHCLRHPGQSADIA